jgi:hypothetical protein
MSFHSCRFIRIVPLEPMPKKSQKFGFLNPHCTNTFRNGRNYYITLFVRDTHTGGIASYNSLEIFLHKNSNSSKEISSIFRGKKSKPSKRNVGFMQIFAKIKLKIFFRTNVYTTQSLNMEN